MTVIVTDHTALLSGSYWNGIEVVGTPVFLTYSFAATATADHANQIGAGALATFTALDTAQQNAARDALEEWADASGITLLEVGAGHGQITFSGYDFTGTPYNGAGGAALYPFGDWNNATKPYFFDDSPFETGGDVLLNTDLISGGLYAYATVLHEIGHALGFKHPTEEVTSALPIVHDQVLATDDPNLTIMATVGGGTGHLTALDIAAVQFVYGNDTQDGTQVFDWDWDPISETLVQQGYGTGDVMRGVDVDDLMLGMDGDDRIFALGGDDEIDGGDGIDTLHGGSGDDTIKGGYDNDTMTGGTGEDWFLWQTGDGNDIITDFSLTDDKIDISQVFGVKNIGDLTIDPNFGSAKIVFGAESIVLNGVDSTQLTDENFKFATPVPHDVNGDGRSDFVWRHINGATALWEMDGGNVLNKSYLDSVSLSWTINSVADFNGDGNADIMWRHQNGKVALWEMDGPVALSQTSIASVSTAWRILGSGDFDGDGTADLLWRHTNGSVAIWDMDGTTINAKTLIANQLTNTWKLVGTDDFTGDGNDDLLWRHIDGRVGIWEMDGATVLSKTTLTQPNIGWHIIGTGNYCGCSEADILWRQDDGRIGVWDMEAGFPVSKDVVSYISSDWLNNGTGDFDGDGLADLLFREQASGLIGIMDFQSDPLLPPVSNNWQIFKEGFEYV